MVGFNADKGAAGRNRKTRGPAKGRSWRSQLGPQTTASLEIGYLSSHPDDEGHQPGAQ